MCVRVIECMKAKCQQVRLESEARPRKAIRLVKKKHLTDTGHP